MSEKQLFENIEQIIQDLEEAHYIADRALATVLFLSHKLQKPLFLEGSWRNFDSQA